MVVHQWPCGTPGQVLASRLAEPRTAPIPANNLSAIGARKGLSGFGLFGLRDVSLVAIDAFLWADVFEPKPDRGGAAGRSLRRRGGADAGRAETVQGRVRRWC